MRWVEGSLQHDGQVLQTIDALHRQLPIPRIATRDFHHHVIKGRHCVSGDNMRLAAPQSDNDRLVPGRVTGRADDRQAWKQHAVTLDYFIRNLKIEVVAHVLA